MTDKEKKESHETVESSIGSILFSIILVAAAMGFVFGFKYFLAGRTYRGPEIPEVLEEEKSNREEGRTALEEDTDFKYEYIVIQGLSGKELRASEKPDENSYTGSKLEEGQILKVSGRGIVDGKFYYILPGDLYLRDSKSIMPLKEYILLDGYVTITYINSTGVRLRRWPDFDADNIVSSAYVGDKVDIKGRVTTVTNTTAFVTKSGCYMTTNSRYLNDHTTVVPDKKSGTESKKETDTKSVTESEKETETKSVTESKKESEPEKITK